MARIGGCYNIADFQWQARKRLPTPLYHYIEGGADDELTRAANTAAFDRYALVPDYLHDRSEEHTSELQSLMRISYAVFCLKKKHKENELKQPKVSNPYT